MKRLDFIAAAVFATLIAVLAMWQLRSIVLLFVVSLAVSSMVRWPITFLTSRRVPQGLAVAFVYLIGIGVVVGVIFLIAPLFAQQAPALVKELGEAYTRFHAGLADSAGRFEQMAVRFLPAPNSMGVLGTSAATDLPVDVAVGATMGLFEGMAQSLLVIVLSVYWMSDLESAERLWLSLLPPDQRTRARQVTRAIGSSMGEYLRSEAAQTLLAGMLLYGLFTLIGAKYALLLAVVAALAWLIPIVGALFAVVPVALIALLSGPVTAALAAVATLAVFALLEFVVERKLYKRRRYGSLWGVVAALVMLEAFGVLGLVLAPVVATVVQIVFEELVRPEPAAAATKPTLDLASLRARITAAQAELQELEEPSQRTAGMLERLSALLDKVEQAA